MFSTVEAIHPDTVRRAAATQRWAIGQVVSVGFVKGLVVKAHANGEYALWQPATNRSYSFQPHKGLTRIAA